MVDLSANSSSRPYSHGRNQDQTTVSGKLAEKQETSSHISVHPLYTPADLEGWDYDRDLSFPGQFPYTRGVQATMYRGRLWTMRQYAGMGDADESNRRYKYLLSQGTTGLSVAFDLPTQIGLDSDNPLAMGEVGKVGVAIDSIEDMMRLFDGINLEKISTSMTINATASILLALYIGVGAAHRARCAQAVGHHTERCAEGIHRARDLHLSAGAGDAHHHRHLFLRQRERARVEHYFHFRLSHARGGMHGGAGSRVHAGQRHHLRAGGDRRGTRRGQVRAAAVVLLQRAQQFSGRGGEVPRRPPHVGAHHARSLQGEESEVADAALPHPDRGLDADGAAAGEQHRPHRAAGHGGGAGRNAVAAHQFVRRGAGAAHRAVGAHRAAHAADHRLRIGRAADHRSAGRLVLHRVADQPD